MLVVTRQCGDGDMTMCVYGTGILKQLHAI